MTEAAAHLDAIYNFTADEHYDEYSSVIQSFGYLGGQMAIDEALQYTKPQQDGGRPPPCFDKFMTSSPLMNNAQNRSMSDYLKARDHYNSMGSRYVVRSCHGLS